jgi:hypothetical protein
MRQTTKLFQETANKVFNSVAKPAWLFLQSMNTEIFASHDQIVGLASPLFQVIDRILRLIKDYSKGTKQYQWLRINEEHFKRTI